MPRRRIARQQRSSRRSSLPISPALLLNCELGAISERGGRSVRWAGVPAPSPILPRWAVVPLIPTLGRASSVAEAAAWYGIARSTAYSILSTTAHRLDLHRRWRHPYQWSRDLVARLTS